MPQLLIDGDCGFCLRSAAWARRWVRPSAAMVPWKEFDLPDGLTPEACRTAVQWVDAGVVTAAGGRAVCALLRTAPAPWPAIAALASLPGAAEVVDAAYRVVARNRHRLPGRAAACAA